MKNRWNYAAIFATRLILLSAAAASRAFAGEVSGAGSTFASPIMERWMDPFKSHSGLSVSYRPTGSGSGVWLAKNRIVDFAVSDASLTSQQLLAEDLVQFPIVIGAVAPIFNLPGIQSGKLKLTGAVIASIYLGKISKWNDPAIAKLNPELILPDKLIITAHRGDDSGTKYIFVNYLAKVSSEYRQRGDMTSSIGFPYGGDRGGSERVVTFVAATDGAIGYVEYDYVKRHNLSYAVVQNREGDFVALSNQAVKSAVRNANWFDNVHEPLTNLPGRLTWPICGATYAVMTRVQPKREAAISALTFFDWIFHNGDLAADNSDYVAVPKEIADSLEKAWSKIKTADGALRWPDVHQ